MKPDVWTEKDIAYLQILQQDITSLDGLIAAELNDGDTVLEISQALVSEEPNPEELAIIQCRKEYISSVIKKLDPREQKIILMRFGFETGEPMTFEEIGDKFNVSKQAIHIVGARAMTKLKARIKKENLW